MAIEMGERLADLARLGPPPDGVKAEERPDGVEITIEQRWTRPMQRGIGAFAVSAAILLWFVLPAAAFWAPDSVWTVVIFVAGIGTLAFAPAVAAEWAQRRGIALGTHGGTIRVVGDELRIGRFVFPEESITAITVTPGIRASRDADDDDDDDDDGGSGAPPDLPRARRSAGRLDALEVWTRQGRVRFYEGADPAVLRWTRRVLRAALDRPHRATPDESSGTVISAAASGNGFGISVAVVGVVFGLAVLAFTVSELTTGWASRSWPVVEGRVTASESDANGVDFRYEYTVDGRTHAGKGLGFGYNPVGNLARDTVRAHGVGSTIPVRYDPDDPARSAILPEPGAMTWLFLAFGALMAGSGVASLLGFGRRGGTPQRELVGRYRVPWLALPPPLRRRGSMEASVSKPRP